RLLLHRRGGGGRADLTLPNGERSQTLARIDYACHGRIAHYILSVGGDQLSLRVHAEIAGAGKAHAARSVLGYKEAAASDGDVRRNTGGFQVSVIEVSRDRPDLRASAHLNRIARARGSQRLVEQILEVRLLILVSNRVQVGKVVGNHVQSVSAGGKTG